LRKLFIEPVSIEGDDARGRTPFNATTGEADSAKNRANGEKISPRRMALGSAP
jgi:hypothetical protein